MSLVVSVRSFSGGPSTHSNPFNGEPGECFQRSQIKIIRNGFIGRTHLTGLDKSVKPVRDIKTPLLRILKLSVNVMKEPIANGLLCQRGTLDSALFAGDTVYCTENASNRRNVQYLFTRRDIISPTPHRHVLPAYSTRMISRYILTYRSEFYRVSTLLISINTVDSSNSLYIH